MLPKHKTPPRLQQLPHLLHHTIQILHCTQHLNTQYSIQTPLCNPLFSQNIAVFDATREKLVLILETSFLDLYGNLISILGVGVDGVYDVYEGWIVAVNLVAWSGAQFKNLAFSSADEGGDTSGVFIGDKALGCARESVYNRLD
jgi:hypothetical protein